MPPITSTARTLLGTVPVTVAHHDGTASTIQVKRLAIRPLYAFSRHLAAMEGPELVALCTGQPAEWCDTLTPEAFSTLHKTALDLNFTNAAKLAEGDLRLAALILPFIQDARMVALIGLSAQTAMPSPGASGPDTSPAPAPSASAEATGSAV